HSPTPITGYWTSSSAMLPRPSDEGRLRWRTVRKWLPVQVCTAWVSPLARERPRSGHPYGVFEQSGKSREPALMEQPLPGAPLSRDDFVVRLQASRRTLWCIAAAVLGGRSHADDVLQEAAVVALSKLDQFNPATSFTAWMGQIVRFVALNESRR